MIVNYNFDEATNEVALTELFRDCICRRFGKILVGEVLQIFVGDFAILPTI